MKRAPAQYPPHLQTKIDEAERKRAGRGKAGTNNSANIPAPISDAKAVSLVLPIPPNANNYRGISWKARRFFLRPPAIEYRATVKARALAAGIREPMQGEVDVSIRIFRARRSGDTDGFLKVLLDAMQESVYVNDKQVRDIFVERRDSKERPRVEVDVRHVPDPLFEARGGPAT